ncbi:unnamed protein product [Rhizophagus irregularis]|nr:unnamed protein product [Rhizophagus irregularis]
MTWLKMMMNDCWICHSKTHIQLKKKKELKELSKRNYRVLQDLNICYIYIFFLKKDGGILCYKDEVIYARMGKYFQTSKQSLPIPSTEILKNFYARRSFP